MELAEVREFLEVMDQWRSTVRYWCMVAGEEKGER